MNAYPRSKIELVKKKKLRGHIRTERVFWLRVLAKGRPARLIPNEVRNEDAD